MKHHHPMSTSTVEQVNRRGNSCAAAPAMSVCLMLRSPRDRVLHCLRLERNDEGRFKPPGTLMQWVATLGIAHATLYRPLANLEREGLVVRDGNQIVLAKMRHKMPGLQAAGNAVDG
ncbi:hypothetical protein AB4Y42_41810 [Paraburkholderia sp. EG286B]|uniref:hypothetical protein n=1 Tax=Paraburkholderia sp. EG286B TaxID=3237011 RepID=UPI0034D260D8